MAAAVAVDTTRASSKRIIAVHSTSATTMAAVIDTIDHGLNISQAGVPVRSASRPPSQNQPLG